MGQVINIQQSGGLGIVSKSEDGVSGMIIQVPAPTGGETYVLNNVYKIGAASELAIFGIDAAYDVTYTVQCFQAVKEFFEINPKGTLYLQLTTQAATMIQMFDPSVVTSAIKLVNASGGKVKQIAGVFNPATPPADFEVALVAAISQANLFALYCMANDRPLHVVLEGLGISGATDTRALLSKHVSVMLGQNDAFYALGAYAQKHTSIGRALGVVSLASVNENIGWVGKFNLLAGAFVQARINGVLVNDMTPTQLATLDTNGYLYFKTYTDYPGIYMNDSWTCTTDTDDYSKIEKNRAWNKAARLLRPAMLPYVNGTVIIDPVTGFIDEVTIAAMEANGNKAIRAMFQAGEISGPDPQGATPPFQIDPKQDVLSTSMLNTQLSIVPTGVASVITNYIGFKNPNN